MAENWKTQQWPQDWKRSFFIPVPKKSNAKDVKAAILFQSFHMLAKLCSKSFKLGFSSTWTKNFQMYKLYLGKARGTRDQIANIHWIIEKAREFQKNMYFCFFNYAKASDCVNHNKLWKILKEMRIQTILPVSWETCMRVKKQQLEPYMEQLTGSKIGKEYDKPVIVTLFI